MAKQMVSIRLNELHIKVLKSLAERMSLKNGTQYSQANIMEMALVCLWRQEMGDNIYEAFAAEDSEATLKRQIEEEQ